MSFPTSWRKCPQVASALHSAGARHRARPTQPEFESPERERPETQRERAGESEISCDSCVLSTLHTQSAESVERSTSIKSVRSQGGERRQLNELQTAR